MIEIKGITTTGDNFDNQIRNSDLLLVCPGIALRRPIEFNSQWASDVNQLLSFYALDIASFSYGRTLIFSHKTSFLHEPDSNGYIYAYSSRGESVGLNKQLIESSEIPDSIRDQILPLVLQTFRHDHVSTYLLDKCSYVPTSPEFQSYPFAPLLKEQKTLNQLSAQLQPIRVTYPHRMLLDSFGGYRTHEQRVFDAKLELALMLGFRVTAGQSEMFFSDMEMMVAPDGDHEKFSALIQYFKAYSEKKMDTKAQQQLSAAYLRLPTLFAGKPHGRFGSVGASSGFVPNSSNNSEVASTRYSIAHRGKHLAIIDVIPNLPKRNVNAYSQRLAGAPARYQYLIINSVELGRKVFPEVPLISLNAQLPIGISQYLPETKTYTALDQKHKLYKKRHLLGGFFINPVNGELAYTRENTEKIVLEVQKSAAENPAERLYPELFSVDHDYIVKASLSSELLDALRFFKDRNALHEAYSVMVKAPSLPGAQSKMPVAFDHQNAGVVIKPSDAFEDLRFTHILKLPVDANNSADDKDKAGLCAIEFLGMFTASKLGLEVPRFGLVSWPSLIKELDLASPKGDLSKEPAYIIERFDITSDAEKSFVLKEFQALMGEYDKFKTIHGIQHSAESVCLALKRHSTDFESDKFKLLRFLIVNEIIGNTDMHLKNIAMLQELDEEKNVISCRLSPAYDIASVDALNPTYFLNSNDVSLAKGLTYNGKIRPSVSDWVRISETCLDISGEQCLAIVDDISERARQFIKNYSNRYISEVFTKNTLLREQYDRAMRRLSLGVKILSDRAANRDGQNVPYEEFKSVWNKTYEEAQRDEARNKVIFDAVKRGGEAVNRGLNAGEGILAALLLPETSGKDLDGKLYQPGGTEQVMISDVIQEDTNKVNQGHDLPDINDLPEFLRG